MVLDHAETVHDIRHLDYYVKVVGRGAQGRKQTVWNEIYTYYVLGRLIMLFCLLLFSDPFIMVVSVGRKAGIGQKGSSLLPEFMVRMLKSRDMMTGRYWKEMGQKPPR